jgi:hypothetical protein
VAVTVVEVGRHGDAVIYSSYRASFVEDLKSSIPMRRRSWDGHDKCWQVQHPYADIAIAVCRRHYRQVTVRDRRPTVPPPAPPHRPTGDNAFAALRALLPAALWPGAYRALARAQRLELVARATRPRWECEATRRCREQLAAR